MDEGIFMANTKAKCLQLSIDIGPEEHCEIKKCVIYILL